MDAVWVFNGEGGTFPSAVFTTKEQAEIWIAANKLSGCLTKYPLDVSIYDWVIAKGDWSPKLPYQHEPKFKQRFSSASLDHHHYQNGSDPEQSAAKSAPGSDVSAAWGSKSDVIFQEIVKALKLYEAKHPQAIIEAYRHDSVSVRVRIINPMFKGLTRVEREEELWQLLEQLPEETVQEISLLLLLTPEEAKKSFASAEFDDPIPSRL